MRIACPPLIYACPFVGFSASKNALELITRRIITHDLAEVVLMTEDVVRHPLNMA